MEKEYICKVVGEFPTTDSPDGIVCEQPITQFNRKFGCCAAWKIDGFEFKDACTHFHRISTDGKTSVVLCKPKTGIYSSYLRRLYAKVGNRFKQRRDVRAPLV